jgi:hypothetical protein
MMQAPMRVPGHLSTWIIILSASGAAVGTCTWLFLRGRKRKTAAEIERDRRLLVNAIGRMTDGSLTEALTFGPQQQEGSLLFYRYSVAGVEYSAAQEISDLAGCIPAGTYLPGETLTIKYDPQHPPNSIVVCEEWSGLHTQGDSGSEFRQQGSRAAGE